MPVQTVTQGLESPAESVVSKRDLVKSIVASLQQGQLETAASLYRRSQEDVGYEVMNEVGRGPLAPALANVLLEVKDFYKAAQVFESLEMKREAAAFDSAAELFANIGDLAGSAEMFERGGAYARAAPLFEQAERWLDAARNHAKAEEHFLAGRDFAKGGDEKKALECLQKVQPGDPSHPEAVDLLGPILERLGFPEIAIDKYRGIVADEGVTPENVGVFYRIARIQESSGQLEEARQTYSKILEKDLGYQDVQQRYRALKERAQPSGAALPSPPATGAPSGAFGLVVLDEDTSLFEKSVLFQDLSFDEMRELPGPGGEEGLQGGRGPAPRGKPGSRTGSPAPRDGRGGHEARGQERQAAEFGPGDHFGEMTVCGLKNARVTAVAETDGDCVIVPGDRVRRLLEGHPALAVKILRNMMAAMDVHLDQYVEVVRALWKRGGGS